MPPFAYPTPEPTDSPSSRDESKIRKRDERCSTDDTDRERPSLARKRQKAFVNSGNLCYPASHYHGHQPPLPVIGERQAINELAEIWNAGDRSQEEHNIWKLNKFSVYRKATDSEHPKELCSLHYLKTEKRFNELLFDGIISVDEEHRFVQGVSFDCLTIEGYGDESNEISACIQTPLGRKANVYYQLGHPANEYQRYHEAFLWVSRFAKFVVAFLEDSGQPVTLSLFRQSFHANLLQKYGSSATTQKWLNQYQTPDFGQAFCAYIGFLIKECWSINDRLLDEPIFRETDPEKLLAISEEETVFEKTIVTPFVFDLFKKLPFHSHMQVLHNADASTLLKRHSRRIQLGLTPLGCRPSPAPQVQQITRAIQKGDVASILADTKNQWRQSTGAVWYIYVQDIRTLKTGAQKLDVLWLYEPSDTTLGHGNYPWKNELFLSDNCSCGKDSIDAELVQSIVPVQWYVTNPEACQGFFFVRQKFRTEPTLGAYDFVKLQPTDFRCGCKNTESEMKKVRKAFALGDPVLVYHLVSGHESLEPAIIRGFSPKKITLQPMLRCCRELGDRQAPPNQVVPSDDIYEVDPDSITRRCKIATFTAVENVLPPYDLDGAGDRWFVISQSAPTWNIENQELEVEHKLKGMGIFCGAGFLDRGLEQGGGVTFQWGVEMSTHALHTYRANAEDPKKLNLFLGSVHDYLAKAIQGSMDSKIATIGDVDLLAAGSPCPGFSVLQRDKGSDKSLKNCSLVASVCAYMDFYTPAYLVLENVTGMAKNPKNAKDLNVFSQVLCFLVSVGYQVKQVLMDPAHYGSCQSRKRIFILATAPEYEPPDAPPQTHTCTQLGRSAAIGRASNNLPFGTRKHDVCPFSSLTAREAFEGLPEISDGHVQTCIEVPDHRICRAENSKTRTIIQLVPRWPYGQGFVQAVAAGKMSKQAIFEYRWENKCRGGKNSKAWSRISPDGLVGCLTTDIKPHDAFLGCTLHYDEPRLMSIMEARRVQGMPDDEVVIGSRSQQWKQIGNGVDRKVAFAMGLRFADAFRKTRAATGTDLIHSLQTGIEEDHEESPVQKAPVIREETVVQRYQVDTAESSNFISVFEKKIVSSHVVNNLHAALGAGSDGGAELTSDGAPFVQSVVQSASKGASSELLRDDGVELIVID